MKFQHPIDTRVEPPAVCRMPGRVRIAAGQRRATCLLRLGGDDAQRREGENFGRWIGVGAQQHIGVAGDEAGIDWPRCEIRMGGDAAKQIEIGGNTRDLTFRQGSAQHAQRLIARGGVTDQFGNHRVIVDRNLVALAHAGIDADPYRERAAPGCGR